MGKMPSAHLRLQSRSRVKETSGRNLGQTGEGGLVGRRVTFGVNSKYVGSHCGLQGRAGA